MVKVDRYVELDELNGTESEGQMADYFAAQESGDTSEWEYGVIEYECKQCGGRIAEVNDNVRDYDGLISMWHEKARQGDYFSRYVFEYIAFNAYLKSHIVLDVVGDRTAIQRLKQNEKFKIKYLSIVKKESDLRSTWENLIKELKKEPLLNSSRDIDNSELDKWWNQSGEQYIAPVDAGNMGIISTVKDWPNMVEFWYSIRNNLFHGGKNPNVQRDLFLVEHAFKTLNAFMKMEIRRLGEDLKI